MHFKSLTEEEQHERRQLLDWYGALAQLSVLIPLIATQIYFLCQQVHRRWLRSSSIDDRPSSPYLKARKTVPSHSVTHAWSLFLWWCGDRLRVVGLPITSKGEALAATVWTLWLMALCLAQTRDDYLHVTKRFGLVAASQLPFHFLLAMKSPWSPVQALTRAPHESIIRIHQLTGRIIIFFYCLHASLYLNFYIQSGLLGIKIREAYVLCGMAAMIAFTAIGTTALAPVRRWNYRFFYAAHISLATIVIPLLYFHVRHIRIYLYESIGVAVLNRALRWYARKTFSGSIEHIPSTSLIDIHIEPSSSCSVRNWEPGQHAYVALPGRSLFPFAQSNPFTVASVPSVDGRLRFVARRLNGNTRVLAQAAATRSTETEILVEGPYGSPRYSNRLLEHDRVLLVAGGVGATFIVPIYRQLLSDLSPSKGSHRRQKINFVWSARQLEDVQWALPSDADDKEGFLEQLTLYLTGPLRSGASAEEVIDEPQTPDGIDDSGHSAEPGGGIELEERISLLRTAESTRINGRPHIVGGRPDLATLTGHVFRGASLDDKIAVVVCGPAPLARSLRENVAPYVKKGRHVYFHQEVFDLL